MERQETTKCYHKQKQYSQFKMPGLSLQANFVAGNAKLIMYTSICMIFFNNVITGHFLKKQWLVLILSQPIMLPSSLQLVCTLLLNVSF